MIVEGIGIDPSKQPVVVLKDTESERILPIWIGPGEARAIELELRGVKPDRPLSHDLLLAAIRMAHGKVLQVIVNDLQDATFYATIDIETPTGIEHIDSRPSDAIALAVRAGCPVFIEGNVETALMDAAQMSGRDELPNEEVNGEANGDAEEIERFKRLLGETEDDE
ncbi:MAG: bifunctional nuclease family protein [Abditibacteriaceae bacterium]